MSESYDLLVVGAGPGGMAAAATGAEAGMRVCLIDDNPAPGGQIWRSSVWKTARNAAAAKWIERMERGPVAVRSGWRAVGGVMEVSGQSLRVENEGRFEDIEFTSLILATGARELFLPFPGWTLPGVYGVGGLQAFVKSGFDIRGKRLVIAGTGPLLLAVGAALRDAGARIVSIVEQAPLRRLARFSMGLSVSQPGKVIEGAGYAARLLGVPFKTGSWVTRVHGDERVRSVVVSNGVRMREIETDMLAVGFHLVPSTELAQLLGCSMDEGFVSVDSRQQTSVPGVYCAGEATGIGGVDKAQIEGQIAALDAAGASGLARALVAARDKQRRFVRGLNEAFQLRPELRQLADDATIVCRCEDVTQGALVSCRSWREAKLHTRCGMGPCQGRICGAAAEFLYGWQPPRPRPPLFPVEVGSLAGVHSGED